MKIVGYARVSTKGQDISLGAQREAIERYVDYQKSLHPDWELVGTVEEKGSAKCIEKREGIQEILDMLRTGKAKAVVIYKLDRLTRSIKDLQFLLEDYFTKYTLISLQEEINTGNAGGRMLLNLLTVISQWEREVIGERTREAAIYKKSQEERWGKIPYGKRLGSDGIHLINDPHEQEVIGTIRRLKKQGLSVRGIAKELGSLGYKNRNGVEFSESHKTQVQNILKWLSAVTEGEKNDY